MGKKVPAYSQFIEAPGGSSAVIDWFRSQELPIRVHSFDWGRVIHFFELGELQKTPAGEIEVSASPIVRVWLPKVCRTKLWTTGKVQFEPIPLSRFPQMELTRKSFLRWFNKNTLVFDYSSACDGKFNYYLEGGSQNYGPIRAFPSGLSALEAGQYYVSIYDNEFVLNKVCKTLALRGIHCSEQ